MERIEHGKTRGVPRSRVSGLARWWGVLLVLVSVTLAAAGVWYGYSYWWDELYSVASAELDLADMFHALVLPDVHPPLYQLVLHLWIKAVGAGESVVRALSFFFAMAALGALWWWASRRLTVVARYTLLVFFATCSLFPYYAQEARAYAMLLWLATLASIAYLEGAHLARGGWRLGYYGLLGALSLTHYFGLLYAGLILLFTLYEHRRHPWQAVETLLAGLACLVWPVLHLLYGGIGEKTGDNFWIESSGVQSTLSHFSAGLVPHLNYLARLVSSTSREFVAAALVLVLLGGAAYLARRAPEAHGSVASRGRVLWQRIIALLAGFLVLIALVDHHSPISTPRNYIVLLPLVSILMGLAASGLQRSGVRHVLALVVLGGCANLAVAALEVAAKVHPVQNHKAAVAFIESRREASEPIYYLDRGEDMQEVQRLVAGFYFHPDVRLLPIAIEQVAALAPPYFVLMQHHGHDLDRLLADIARRGTTAKAFVPPQRSESVVVIYAKGHRASHPRRKWPRATPTAARMLVQRPPPRR